MTTLETSKLSVARLSRVSDGLRKLKEHSNLHSHSLHVFFISLISVFYSFVPASCANSAFKTKLFTGSPTGSPAPGSTATAVVMLFRQGYTESSTVFW